MSEPQETTQPEWRVEETEDELQPAIDTYVILRRTADAVARYVERELNEWGLTTPQYGVLLHLMKGEPLSMSDLSRLVFRSASTLTFLIDQMEQDDLVIRVPHENDRRIITVQITSEGQDLLQEVRQHHRPFLADMMSCLSSEELTQLQVLLQKVEARIKGDECS